MVRRLGVPILKINMLIIDFFFIRQLNGQLFLTHRTSGVAIMPPFF